MLDSYVILIYRGKIAIISKILYLYHMNHTLVQYIEKEIIPRYASFDKAHRIDHARTVIGQSLELAKHYDVDMEMVYAIAAYHDTGLTEGRDIHHIASARIIRGDLRLPEWFTPEQIGTMADAAEDHRASNRHEPRTIYGRIVAEADRIIDGDTIIRRTIQFGLSHYAELDREGHFRRFMEHMAEKYAEGGYLKLWIPESPNAARIAAFRSELRNPALIRSKFDRFFDEETNQ